jgi:hypothetical protein
VHLHEKLLVDTDQLVPGIPILSSVLSQRPKGGYPN